MYIKHKVQHYFGHADPELQHVPVRLGQDGHTRLVTLVFDMCDELGSNPNKVFARLDELFNRNSITPALVQQHLNAAFEVVSSFALHAKNTAMLVEHKRNETN